MKKTKKIKFLKGEIFMYGLFLFLMFILMPISCVFTGSLVSESSLKVEMLEKDIKKLQQRNESISMQVNELASLSNIQNVAEEFGLSYNNSNIRVIEGE